jgi:hypothetical protein
MHSSAVTRATSGPVPGPATRVSGLSGRADATGHDADSPAVLVEGVILLGVRVTAYATINAAEHRRREAAGIGAVVNPELLDRLLDLPAAVPVTDAAAWAELAGQPPGIAERGEDGASVTRRLESPLTIADVVVDAAAAGELHAVQDASLFAGFTRRWVAAVHRRIPENALLEAKVCGVGLLDPQRTVMLLPAEKPAGLTADGWSWLLQEKTYRHWLTRRLQPLTEPGFQGQADSVLG